MSKFYIKVWNLEKGSAAHENSMAHKEIEQSAIYKDKLSEVDKAGTYSGGS